MQLKESHHSQYFSGLLFGDLVNPPTGRRTRKQSSALADHYESKGGSVDREGINMIGKLITVSQKNIEQEFQQNVMFGVQLSIWRKGNIKPCMFFLDQSIPSFLWVTTKSKAFLFDLAFTTIQRFNFQLENASKLKDYFVLHYFQQELPVVFTGEDASQQAHHYFELFNSYIIYSHIMLVYPCYFSKIMKRFVVEDIKEDFTRSKKAADVLKVSNEITWNGAQHNEAVMRELVTQKDKDNVFESFLTPQEINDYFKISNCCEGVKEVFQKYAQIRLSNYKEYLTPVMNKKSFINFLTSEQNESKDAIEQVMKESREVISFYDFCSYLLNEKNNYAVVAEKIDQSLPLTDYFCYSSHNTYLSGNQLTSDSKIERYLEDLDNGLKCVEIDVHNEGNRPIVTHAFNDKSFCKSIDFEETINAISKFCRHNQNHYPIILSIENHAKDQNRYRMFNIILNAFDKKLLLVNSELQLHQLEVCKTLSQLRGKVIVKTDAKIKQIKPFHNIHKLQQLSNELQQLNLSSFMSKKSFSSFEFSQRFNSFEELYKRCNARKKQFSLQIQKELYLPLAEMTKITGMFKAFEGIETRDSTGYECTSLTYEKARKADQTAVIQYTKRSWLRIYPVATEIASHNYNPVPHLNIGAQIIALNTQTKDDYAWMLMSYFTGGREMIPSKIGYIPKPIHLQRSSQEKREQVIKMIEVKVLSNEKVEVRFIGSDQDMKYNVDAIRSFTVSNYLQGFLMFTIADQYRDCVAMRFLRTGYRVLVEKNQFFRDSGRRILIHVNITNSH